VVRRAVAPDDNTSSLIEIEFWKQFKTYASITKRRRSLLIVLWARLTLWFVRVWARLRLWWMRK
jgi:hypothetical protein